MAGTQVVAMPPIPTIRVENVSKSALHITTKSHTVEDSRESPANRPPDLPLPNPAFISVAGRLGIPNTPIPSPIASPFKAAPSKLVENLVLEEASYLQELLVLQQIIRENLLAHELDALASPVEKIINLATELSSQLSEKASYFSDPQKNCLIHFSKVAATPYQTYMQSFRLGQFLGLAQSAERIRLMELLHSLDKFGEADRDLDWLLRRPLSRLRSYSNLYKKLLHSSDDATDMFLAYETFHRLLIEARGALEVAREQCEPSVNRNMSRLAQRSVSGDSTSTQSSSNSKVSALDELHGLQDTLDTSQCKDIFSLAPTNCRLSLVPKEIQPRRALVNRANFQLMIQHPSTEEKIDCLVELVLLTDQLLIVRPTFERPQLMFSPLQRGVFHVTSIPSESRILELDIVGRQTLRMTAATKEARDHWYVLLLACEDYKLDTMPAAPATLAQHVGGKVYQSWLPLAPTRMPPTPPHTATNVPSFGSTAPLCIIRENSQLSMGDFSDCSGRTPDAKEAAPFHFDVSDDDATPRAVDTVNPMKQEPLPLQENLDVKNHLAPLVPMKKITKPLKQSGLTFPEPPRRSSIDGATKMTKSKSVNLFDDSSYTDQFLRAPPLGARSKTMKLPETSQLGSALEEPSELREEDEDVFDLSSLDLPTLPAFDFGDGVRRPSSVALDFSPNTMSNFGIAVRKVKAPAPMVLPDVAPLSITPQKTKSAATLSQRRLGNELSLGNARPKPAEISTTQRNNLFFTMAECFTWINGTWTPILMDDVDQQGKMKTVRSSRITIFFNEAHNGFLEIYDIQSRSVINTFGVYSSTSIIRDDPCDISVGFDVGLDKVYYMFRAENPIKANALQHSLNQAKFAAPQKGFFTPVFPITPMWPELDNNSVAAVESLKIKLYLFDNGKWVNKGSARLTIRLISKSRNRRVSLTAKTKKNSRMMVVDHIAEPGDCEALSKTSISLKTRTETYMMQFKGGEKERAKILDILVD